MEEILKLIERIKGFVMPYPIESLLTKEEVAKEITAHFFEFIEWFAKSIQYNDVHDYYKFNDRIKGMISIFDTKEELYEYWLTNVK